MKRRDFLTSTILAGSGIISGKLSASEKKQLGQISDGSDYTQLTEMEQYDVIVCGAGPAGIAAAISAARKGAKTKLIEVHGCLGGVWTAGMLSWIIDMEKQGLASEITQRLDNYDARRREGRDKKDKYVYEPEIMKFILEEMCVEAGVSIRLFTRVVAAKVDTNKNIESIFTESKSGREEWKAKVFIDTTGDGDLAALAGNGFDLGHPVTGQTQPMTLMGLIRVKSMNDVAPYLAYYPPAWSLGLKGLPQPRLLAEINKAIGKDSSYKTPTLFAIRDGVIALMVNHEYGYSSINANDLTKATLVARKELNEICFGLRKLGGPWEDVTLVATAEQIGVREGRRIHGRYTVTWKDAVEGKRHDDGIANITFNIDLHSFSKTGSNTEEDIYPKEMKKYLKSNTEGSLTAFKTLPYDIPLRALIAKDVNNLLMAGRCISGDWFAHGSYRVTGDAVAMGEAAGILAQESVSKDKPAYTISPKDVIDKLK